MRSLRSFPRRTGRTSARHSAQMFGSAAPDRLQGMVAPLRRAVRYLRAERAETRQQPVGCVGFCMGGSLSALLACEEPELSAAAVYYGNAPVGGEDRRASPARSSPSTARRTSASTRGSPGSWRPCGTAGSHSSITSTPGPRTPSSTMTGPATTCAPRGTLLPGFSASS